MHENSTSALHDGIYVRASGGALRPQRVPACSVCNTKYGHRYHDHRYSRFLYTPLRSYRPGGGAIQYAGRDPNTDQTSTPAKKDSGSGTCSGLPISETTDSSHIHPATGPAAPLALHGCPTKESHATSTSIVPSSYGLHPGLHFSP